jgi:hypothetical protein
MPIELAILLAVVIGAIWLLVKIIQGLAAVLDAVRKDYRDAALRRKDKRFAKGRDALRPYVHVLTPDELDRFEKESEATRIEFEKVQRRTRWVASPPSWRKEEFHPIPHLHKSSSCIAPL